MRKLSFFFFFFFLFCLSGCTQPDTAADHVISHRGACDEALEHTLAAYDLAIAYGSKYIEQDLVLSKDGTIYISHDLSAERMTGDARLFSEMTDAEIDALRTADGQQILKLSELLSYYGDRVYYVAELKQGQPLVDAFLRLVADSELPEEQFIVQSWSLDVLNQIEQCYPNMLKLFLLERQDQLNQKIDVEWVDIVAIPCDLMDANNCNTIHEMTKKVCVWTLNSKEQILTAIQLGVDLYFTNHTALALELEEQYRNTNHG